MTVTSISLKRFGIWCMMALVSAVPLFFVPFIQDFYDTGKWYLIALISLISLSLWVMRYIFTKRTLHIEYSPYITGLGLCAVVSIASVIFNSSNKVEAILSPFGPVTFISLGLLGVTISSFTNDHTRHLIRWFMYGSITLLALICIYQGIGIGTKIFPSIPFLKDATWTPTGSLPATITILLITIPLMIKDVLEQVKQRNESAAAISSMMVLTTIVGLGVSVWQFLPHASSLMLPFSTGWVIMLEILKHGKRMLLGVGAENFLTAFSIGRPQSYNISPVWNIRFTSSTNFLFHITTIYGAAGLAAWIVLAKSLVPYRKLTLESLIYMLSSLAMLFAPPSLAVLYIITLTYISSPYILKKHIAVRPMQNMIGNILVSFIILTVSVASVYGLYRSFNAEQIFYSSLQKAKENNGTQTYNTQIKSIQANPYISRYHLIYSQTNLALAVSLTNAINQSQEQSTSEQKSKDQQLVAQLIQQSIREAKLATSLNTQSILAWENLARIYAQLIDIAQGADTWTVASYNKAIELDPYNPILRIELGSIAMKKKQYADAITQFQKSITLKQNFANAYYNLAYAYKANGDTTNTLSALKMTQSLLDSTSPDFEKVKKEIQSLSEIK